MKAKKIVILIAAFALVAGLAVAGTLAYLTSQSDPVTNKFVAAELGEVSVAETESSYDDGDNNAKTNSYLVIPGVGIAKDPKVTFKRGTDSTTDDVDAYVFVKMTASGWTKETGNYTYTKGKMSFSFDSTKWAYLEDGVYYTTVDAGKELEAVPILAADTNGVTITVAANATKSEIDTAAANADLVFTPYAIQKASFADAAAAWAALK